MKAQEHDLSAAIATQPIADVRWGRGVKPQAARGYDKAKQRRIKVVFTSLKALKHKAHSYQQLVKSETKCNLETLRYIRTFVS